MPRRGLGHVEDGRVIRQCPLRVTPLTVGHTSIEERLRLLLRRGLGHVEDGRVVRQCPLRVTPLTVGQTSIDERLRLLLRRGLGHVDDFRQLLRALLVTPATSQNFAPDQAGGKRSDEIQLAGQFQGFVELPIADALSDLRVQVHLEELLDPRVRLQRSGPIRVAARRCPRRRIQGFLQLRFGKPGTQELGHQFQGTASLVLDLQAKPHQRFCHFIERFFAPFLRLHVTTLLQVAQLLGAIALGNEAVFGDLLDRHRSVGVAQALHDAGLLGRQGANSFLEIGRQIFGQMLERMDEIVQRFLGQKLGQQHVHAMIPAGQMMQSANSIASFGRIEISHQIALLLFQADLADQFSGIVYGQGRKVLDVKEPEERLVAPGDSVEQLLRRGQRGNAWLLLQESPPLLLPQIAKSTEDPIQVLHDQEDIPFVEAGDDRLQDRFGGIIRIQTADGRAVVRVKLLRVFRRQLAGNSERDIDQARERIVFAQPGDPHRVRQLAPPAQFVFDESDQVRLPAAARTDQQNVMLVVGQHAASQPVDDFVQQTLTLNEDPLQQFAIRVAGRVG